jgi:hypothetical protein
MDRPEAELPPGRYQHFKGNLYEVLGVARHSETQEELVVYRPLYGPGGLWVRPLRMFRERVPVNGEPVPRFRHLGPAPGAAVPEAHPE